MQKKLFFAFICQTIHISAKITIFWDHLKKIDFFIKKSFFAFICQTIHISAKIMTFWDHLKNINFLPKNRYLRLSAKLYTFRQKWRYFEITLKEIISCQKIVFCVYLDKYTHFGKNKDILRSPEKKIFFAKKSFLRLSG